MLAVLLVISLGFLAAAILGYRADRTALRNGVFGVVGLVGLVEWVGLALDWPSLTLLIVGVASVLLVVSLPVLVVALLANGLVMFRREARTLGNLLSLLVGIGLVGLAVSMTKIFGQENINLVLAWLWFFVAAVAAYASVAFLLYLLMSWLYSAVPSQLTPRYGIVLGSRLIHGKVPPLLRARLDTALEQYRLWEERGRAVTLIPSGGQGPDESRPEGEAMGEYLLAHGVPADRVIVEDRAVNTRENLEFSRALMDDPQAEAIVVTNNFHVFRAAILCRQIGLRAHVYGSRTKFYYLPSAVMREFVAIMVQHKWLNLAVVVAVLVMCVAGYLGVN